MKYLVVAVALALVSLLPTAAEARSAACKTEKGARIDCKKKSAYKMRSPRKARTLGERGITPADKENLDRARGSSSLRNIELQRIGR